jgi:multidrug resistance protein, MATE family
MRDDDQVQQSKPTADLISRLYNEMREQFQTAMPTLASMLLYRFPWLVSLRFVGGIGADELAAAALATTLCNVTGMSLSVGLSSAMTTLTGQSRGDLQAQMMMTRTTKVRFRPNGDDDERSELVRNGSHDATNYNYTSTSDDAECPSADSDEPLLPLVFLYRGLFIQLLIVLPIGFWWLYGIEPVLLALGQGPVLSAMTEQYLRMLTVGLWSYSVNWTLTSWLQAIEMADVPMYSTAVGLVTHIPFNIFFIYTLGWGFLGCAVATVICQLIQPILMIYYLFLTPAGKERVLANSYAQAVGRTSLSFWPEAKLAVTSWRGIVQYLGLALPGIVAISEWWASEVSIFLSGRLTPSPALALGAMTLYQSINSFCFMFPVSFSIAGSARVGNLLGAGKSQAADFAGKVSILCAGAVSGLLGCILYFTPHTFFPSMFAPAENDLALETSLTIPLLAFYVFADGLQAALNGIIKGCGRQVITMPIVVVAYWVVAVPLAYNLAFVRHGGFMCDDNYFCGIVGLVTGMTTGTWIHMLLLGAVVLGATDWDKEAKKAKSRLGTPKEIECRLAAMEDTLNSIDMLSM